VLLAEVTGTNTTELLHVTTNTKEITEVNAESTDISTGLTRDPEDTEVALLIVLNELGLVDGTDTELTLDSRVERGTLEDGASELGKSLGDLLGLAGTVKTDDGNILLTSALLRLDKTSSTINANKEVTGDLYIMDINTNNEIIQR
jgi:hypothetical protein